MKRLTMTVAAIALTAGTAGYAQTADENTTMNDADSSMEQNLEQAGENAEQAAENTGEAIESGAEEAGQEMEQAADEAGQEMEEAGQEMQQAADEADSEMNEAMADADDLFANDEDGLIRVRDILGGTVYAVNADAGDAEMDDAAAAEGDTTMATEGDTEMAEGDTAMEPTADTEMAQGDSTMAPEGNGEMASGSDMSGYDTVSEDWDNVGSIEDIVLNADGSLEGVVAEVGGFLDIGDKHIHISLDDVKLMPIDDGTYVIVTNYTQDQMMEMPDVDESFAN